MNKPAAIFAFYFLLTGISFSAHAATSSSQVKGSRVYVVSGNVYIRHGKKAAHKVVGSEAVSSATAISTGKNSSALIKFEDGETVTMQANSVLIVRNYRYRPAKVRSNSIVLSMFKGGMRFITGLIGQNNRDAVRLKTPNATIGIRGTDFMVRVVNGKMYSKVNTGAIDLTNGSGRKILKAGRYGFTPSSRSLTQLISASSVPAGMFDELMSIPLDPSAIPAPAKAPHAKIPAPSAGAAGIAGGAAISGGAAVAGAMLGSSKGSKKTKPVKKVVPVAKSAEEEKKAEEEEPKGSKSGFGLTAKAGTLGLGGDINMGLSDSISMRAGFDYFKYKTHINASSMNFNFNLKLKTAHAIADWYPFQGSFRASGGIFYNANRFSLIANPSSGNFTLNGTPYSTGQIASVNPVITFNKVAPYFGVGWGNPVAKGKGWGFTSDFGVLFQGKPVVDLTIVCPSTCPGSLATDAEAERIKLQNDLKNFQWWPVATFGISYQW